MIRLFVNYYRDAVAVRCAELNWCLQINAVSPWLDEVVVMAPPDTLPPTDFVDKLRIVDYTVFSHQHPSGRPTFRQFLREVWRRSDIDDVNVIVNNDIVFDDTLRLAEAQIQKDELFALTRWDFVSESEPQFYGRPDSQDAWIFRGSPRTVEHVDFPQGYPGCDSRFAYEAYQAGYEVSNPSLTIKALHEHRSNFRREPANNGKSPLRIPKPYLLLKPTELSERIQSRHLRFVTK
jgi:hypothetical protein